MDLDSVPQAPERADEDGRSVPPLRCNRLDRHERLVILLDALWQLALHPREPARVFSKE